MLDNLLSQLPVGVRETVARLLLAFVALLLTWVFRSALSRLIIGPLRRRAAKTPGTLDDSLIDILERPVQLLILAVGLSLAVQILAMDEATNRFIGQLIRTLVIFAVGLAVYQAVNVISFSSAQLRTITGIVIEARLVPFMRVAMRLVIIALATTIIIQAWGYDVSGLIAGLGLGGLAFSLAAKDTVENLFGFSAIVTDRPFEVGDYIVTADAEGTVENVGLRSTAIRRPDQARVTVPNSRMSTGPVTNWSRLVKRQISFTLGLTYDTTGAQMQTLLDRLRALLTGHPRVEKGSVSVFFTEFGENALKISISAYLLIPDGGQFMHEREALNLNIMQIIGELGLSLA
jgi:MscS family membrane protein